MNVHRVRALPVLLLRELALAERGASNLRTGAGTREHDPRANGTRRPWLWEKGTHQSRMMPVPLRLYLGGLGVSGAGRHVLM